MYLPASKNARVDAAGGLVLDFPDAGRRHRATDLISALVAQRLVGRDGGHVEVMTKIDAFAQKPGRKCSPSEKTRSRLRV